MAEAELRKLYRIAAKDTSPHLLSEVNSLLHQKSPSNRKNSIAELRKLLKVNHTVQNVIQMEDMMNRDPNLQKKNNKIQREMSPRPPKKLKSSNSLFLPDLKQLNCQTINKDDSISKINLKKQELEINTRKRKVPSLQQLGNPDDLLKYETLIDDYIEKIKKENLWEKYQNRGQLVKEACQHIKGQIQLTQINPQNKKTITIQDSQASKADKDKKHGPDFGYLGRKRSISDMEKKNKVGLFNEFRKQHLSLKKQEDTLLPTSFRKTKRINYSTISNITYLHDVEKIKRSQLLDAKKRERQERVFLRKMRLLGIVRGLRSQL